MPVVTLACPEHERLGELLLSLADTIAATLDLGSGDVIAVHQPTGASAASGARASRGESAWTVVTVNGSDRGEAPARAVFAVAEECVRSWWARKGIECEGVWVQWQTPWPLR